MGSEGRRTVRRPQADGHVCPACGQPVGSVIRRRKTLGAFVPSWGPGPCHNPQCPEYSGNGGGKPGEAPHQAPGEAPHEAPGEGPPEGPAAGVGTA
ncbi:hypothetical protein OIE54_14375 [Streptomyces sp. NBC_01794]|nr:hypothetical protein [Streptomyces sp. NBC_01750]WSB00382.1 hypothetical protein OIE54_14375 [Streptomyces sp. NBC_01794]WSD35259.1 hypothetical protein OG966_27245 [Streptomyces sp. NBC_01750]